MNLSLLPKSKPVSVQSSVRNIVIIDDDSCHNIVCALSLKKFFKTANINVMGFTNAYEGLDHLRSLTGNSASKTILFLDINMPSLSGWEVLAKLEAMPRQVKENLIVYILSSNITASDRATSYAFSFVKGCLEKPLLDHLIFISEELTEIALMEKMYA